MRRRFRDGAAVSRRQRSPNLFRRCGQDTGMVIITCPVTRRPVPTGIAMDAVSFQSSTLMNNSVSCPHCGGMHTWSKHNAYLS